MSSFRTGRFLVSSVSGLFPEVKLFDHIQNVREYVKHIKHIDMSHFEVYRINDEGYIQRCNLTGKVI